MTLRTATEGYVNSAFRIRLRPEFALLCGIHPGNTWMTDAEKERWFTKSPADHVHDLVREYDAMLVSLWKDRAKNETLK